MSAGNSRDTDVAGHGVDTTGPSVSTPMAPPRDREAEARKEAGVGIGVNGGAKRDHLGGVRRDLCAAVTN